MRIFIQNLTDLKKYRGFTIVELMVALAVSAFLLLGVVQIFSGSKQTYRSIEQMSRMQENGRYAIELITQNIRNAGYNGCSTNQGVITNTLNTPTSVEYDFSTGLAGFEATASGPGDTITIASENPAASGSWIGGVVPGAVTAVAIPGSDIIVIRGPIGNNVPVMKNNTSAQIFAGLVANSGDLCADGTSPQSGICNGDILMVADCSKSRIFQVTGVQQTSGAPCSPGSPCLNITHSNSGNSPGNSIASWGGASAPEAERFGSDADIVRIQTIIFFIGVGADGSPSLYQRINGNVIQELVSGIENIQFLYGEDTNSDGMADIYRSADNVAIFQDVISVQISLLLRTDNPISSDINTQTYFLGGTNSAYATTIDPFNDRRGRYVYSSTIKLRNRGL